MSDIRCMTYEDIDFAKSLTDYEEWGYTREGFVRLVNLSPDGCFVAWKGEEPVGIVTSIKYADSAFLGTLIVPPQFRGRKIGESLVLHAIDRLKKDKVATIELDGVFPAVPLYRRLNFRDKYLSLRLFRPGLKKEFSPNRKEPDAPCKDILHLDKELTGKDHSRLLTHYIRNLKIDFIPPKKILSMDIHLSDQYLTAAML
ncbi:MAG: GNAT family N-acetyltransferase [Candidatus Zixiibacteriota bacterium]